MTLHDLYTDTPMWNLPFDLLKEREPNQNISHKEMPTWDAHCAFIQSRPYEAWYWFESQAGEPAGCIYLSRQREIGIGVLKSQRRQGLAKAAIQALMEKHPGEFLANINPLNSRSSKMFFKMGFELIQVTYRKEAE